MYLIFNVEPIPFKVAPLWYKLELCLQFLTHVIVRLKRLSFECPSEVGKVTEGHLLRISCSITTVLCFAKNYCISKHNVMVRWLLDSTSCWLYGQDLKFRDELFSFIRGKRLECFSHLTRFDVFFFQSWLFRKCRR